MKNNIEYLNSFIGLEKEKIIKIFKEKEYNFRIVREDSTNYAITMDFNFNRLNLEIDNNLVTKCFIG